jgi:hypothetical protein
VRWPVVVGIGASMAQKSLSASCSTRPAGSRSAFPCVWSWPTKNSRIKCGLYAQTSSVYVSLVIVIIELVCIYVPKEGGGKGELKWT